MPPMLTEVALLVLQLRIADAPLWTELGFAEKVMVGAAAGGELLLPFDPDPPPQAKLAIRARKLATAKRLKLYRRS
jgi:hypothetical protein